MNFPPHLYEPGIKGMAGSLIERVAFKSAVLTFTAASQQQFTPTVPLDKVQALEAVVADCTIQGAEIPDGSQSFWELLDSQGARRHIGQIIVVQYATGAVTGYTFHARNDYAASPAFLLPNWRLKFSVGFSAAVNTKTLTLYAHGWTYPRGMIGDAL